jgi:hypothetical protein
MVATSIFYWIMKNNKKVLIEAGKDAADVLRKGGARKATKKEVENRPSRIRRITPIEAKRLYPPKARKPTSDRPTKTLSPEAKAQADRLRDLSQQAGVPITSEAQAKAFEAFAKGGSRKWWNTLSPKKKATMAAAAGFATVGGLYTWLSTGKGKPDFDAARRAEARAKRQALPGLSLTREEALLRDKKPAKTNGSSTTNLDQKPRRIVSRGSVTNGITRYNSGSFNAAYAKERAKAVKAGEPDTGEFYWRGTKYTTKMKSQKPPVDTQKDAAKIKRPGGQPPPSVRERGRQPSGRKLSSKVAKEKEPGFMPWNWIKKSGPPKEAGEYAPGIRVYKTPWGDLTVDSSPEAFDFDPDNVITDKKGGQVGRSMKKAKPKGRSALKTRKRAALRGHRAELRGG